MTEEFIRVRYEVSYTPRSSFRHVVPVDGRESAERVVALAKGSHLKVMRITMEDVTKEFVEQQEPPVVPHHRRQMLDLFMRAVHASGLTQRQIADRAGVAEQYISRVYKGGGFKGTPEFFDKLAAALGARWEVHLKPAHTDPQNTLEIP